MTISIKLSIIKLIYGEIAYNLLKLSYAVLDFTYSPNCLPVQRLEVSMLKRLKKLKKKKQTVILRKMHGIGIVGILVGVDDCGITIRYHDNEGKIHEDSYAYGTYESIETVRM